MAETWLPDADECEECGAGLIDPDSGECDFCGFMAYAGLEVDEADDDDDDDDD